VENSGIATARGNHRDPAIRIRKTLQLRVVSGSGQNSSYNSFGRNHGHPLSDPFGSAFIEKPDAAKSNRVAGQHASGNEREFQSWTNRVELLQTLANLCDFRQSRIFNAKFDILRAQVLDLPLEPPSKMKPLHDDVHG
jgi:hypothetical protein